MTGQKQWAKKENPLRLSNANENFFVALEAVRQQLVPDGWGGALRDAIESRDVPKLLSLKLSEPQQYSSPEMFFRHTQIVALIKKYPFSPAQSGVDPEKVAWDKFVATERRMKRVNLRFRAVYSRRLARYSEALAVARAWILKVLGENPPLNEIYEKCDFTGGASYGVHGDATNLGRKLMAEVWTVTGTAIPYALGALATNHHVREMLTPKAGGGTPWAQDGSDAYPELTGVWSSDLEEFFEQVILRMEVVDHNLISFVHKKATEYRSVASEPLLNGYLQKGTDEQMRLCLRRHGYDLRDQTPNRAMALMGSLGLSGYKQISYAKRKWISDLLEDTQFIVRSPELNATLRQYLVEANTREGYCTMDLKGASDSVATWLCRYLLPFNWYDFLNQIRSPYYTYNGKHYKYEKFASMGNGFCFPLETLIFASLVRAAEAMCGYPHDHAVYGDDIIVRQGVALYLKELLEVCGFSLNLDKSFFHGPFRESCGADWYGGQAVRPVYLEDPLDDVRRVYSLHNQLIPHLGAFGACSTLRRLVPARLRFCRPSEGLRGVQHPPDTAFTVPEDVFMSCEHSRYIPMEQRWAWKEVISRPVPDLALPEGYLRTYCEYLAVLRGANSAEPLAVRRKTRALQRLSAAGDPSRKYTVRVARA